VVLGQSGVGRGGGVRKRGGEVLVHPVYVRRQAGFRGSVSEVQCLRTGSRFHLGAGGATRLTGTGCRAGTGSRFRLGVRTLRRLTGPGCNQKCLVEAGLQ